MPKYENLMNSVAYIENSGITPKPKTTCVKIFDSVLASSRQEKNEIKKFFIEKSNNY